MAFYLALRLGLVLAGLLPARLFIGATAWLFRAAARLSPARRCVTKNLAAILAGSQAAIPARDPITLLPPNPAGNTKPVDVFESYGRYWGELLAQAARPRRNLLTPLRIEGREYLNQAKARRAVCFLTGHMGNWDLLAPWVAGQVGDLTVPVETLRPPALFKLFVRLREAGGCRILPAEGGGLKLYRRLRGGGHCGLVADRIFGAGIVSGGSRSADFFGGRRSFPSAGMDLARHAGASLVPIFLLRENGGYVIKVHPPLPEGEDPVAAFAKVLAHEIRARPAQWCVLYPLHDAGQVADEAAEARAVRSGLRAKGKLAP